MCRIINTDKYSPFSTFICCHSSSSPFYLDTNVFYFLCDLPSYLLLSLILLDSGTQIPIINGQLYSSGAYTQFDSKLGKWYLWVVVVMAVVVMCYRIYTLSLLAHLLCICISCVDSFDIIWGKIHFLCLIEQFTYNAIICLAWYSVSSCFAVSHINEMLSSYK